ncbi:hypothetical protein [Metapseudomonas resinovorans]|uniref:Secreted protein n=1 Tax=Metapseudomonas resinovorans NBRC 106553 TaxID=1245471 RepID=S6BDG1_METRE|nr:hypothetical protein [Pseudomonas resinovorans]BAN47069.1 hypothetical protein PCA10_13370 [Pseudomonas resinovorans NBRC 106553]
MKSAITTTALSSLLFSIVAFTSMQASSASLQAENQQPLMLAEGGSDRLLQYREMQAQRQQTTRDDSERFVQLIEEKPTAAGTSNEVEPIAKPTTRTHSRIHHMKVEYE